MIRLHGGVGSRRDIDAVDMAHLHGGRGMASGGEMARQWKQRAHADEWRRSPLLRIWSGVHPCGQISGRPANGPSPPARYLDDDIGWSACRTNRKER